MLKSFTNFAFEIVFQNPVQRYCFFSTCAHFAVVRGVYMEFCKLFIFNGLYFFKIGTRTTPKFAHVKKKQYLCTGF